MRMPREPQRYRRIQCLCARWPQNLCYRMEIYRRTCTCTHRLGQQLSEEPSPMLDESQANVAFLEKVGIVFRRVLLPVARADGLRCARHLELPDGAL